MIENQHKINTASPLSFRLDIIYKERLRVCWFDFLLFNLASVYSLSLFWPLTQSTTPSFSLGLVAPSMRSLHALAVFTHTPWDWLGPCGHPQPSTAPDRSHHPRSVQCMLETWGWLTAAPMIDISQYLNMFPQFPHKLKLVAPLWKNDVEDTRFLLPLFP